MTTSPQPCLHVISTPDSSVCERCCRVVPAEALRAARLRAEHHATDLPHFVPQGVSTHFVVKGDHVAEVVLWVRPRRSTLDEEERLPDPAHLTTPFVAEITGGDNLAAVGLHVGLVVEVKAQGVVVDEKGLLS